MALPAARAGVAVVAALVLGVAAPGAGAATFTVNSTADTADPVPADSVCDVDAGTPDGQCTLRAAIQQANAVGGTDTIDFDLSVGTTIQPVNALPEVSAPVAIDGTTQRIGRVVLDGTSAGAGVHGLSLSGGTSSVRGLVVGGFAASGIRVRTNGGNTIAGNYVGTDGTSATANGHGIQVESGTGNVIGGSEPEDRNVISGNSGVGVNVFSTAATTTVRGNYVGTGAAGTTALGNGASGIQVSSGGATITANVVSANNFGVNLQGASGAQVKGNKIGTDASGSADLGNVHRGITSGSGNSNTIGGTAAGDGNVISGNGGEGIALGQASVGNTVRGNLIGTNMEGTAAMPNAIGVDVLAPDNTIGGTAAGAGNVISGNRDYGVSLQASGSQPNGTVIQGNRIGTTKAGTAAIANGEGVRVTTGTSTQIGGSAPGAGNLISGNAGSGVLMTGGSGAVRGNRIGVNADGGPLGNARDGLRLGVSDVAVGGTSAGEGNRIAFNGDDGVNVLSGNRDAIRGNSIVANGSASDDLGIDLNSNGVTGNDTPPDSDLGPNGSQNFPTLTFADTSSSRTVVDGTLSSAAGTTYRIELFESDTCDASGHGEGDRMLGSTDVTTAGGGVAGFSFSTATVVPAGHAVTATATDPAGNTSEFSSCSAVASAPPPQPISVDDVDVDEPAAGTEAATFTVTLAAPSTRTVSVDWTSANGSATAPADFQSAQGTVSFEPGDTSETFSVDVKPDALDEDEETFDVVLSNPRRGTLADDTATATITDEDPPPSLSGTAPPASPEGNSGTSTATVSLTLSEPSAREVKVDYETSDFTATSPSDYVATSGTATFAPGQTSTSVPVTIKGDTLEEGAESFTMTLSNPVHATTPVPSFAVKIGDDDAAAPPPPGPKFSVHPVQATRTETDHISQEVEFKIKCTDCTDAVESVDWSTSPSTGPGEAAAGDDYVAASGTIVHNETVAGGNGTDVAVVTVKVKGDVVDEEDEDLVVWLSDPKGGVITGASASMKILDNDPDQYAHVAVGTQIAEGSGGGTLQAPVAVSTTGASGPVANGRWVSVTWKTVPSTVPGAPTLHPATPGQDFVASSGTIWIPPGSNSGSAKVGVIQDDVVEDPFEYFDVEIVAVTGALKGTDRGFVSIKDDDSPAESNGPLPKPKPKPKADCAATGTCVVLVKCPSAAAAACRGRISHVATRRSGARAARTAKARALFKTARYKIKPGKRAKVKLRLTKAGKARLRRRRTLRVKARIRPDGATAAAARTYTLRLVLRKSTKR